MSDKPSDTRIEVTAAVPEPSAMGAGPEPPAAEAEKPRPAEDMRPGNAIPSLESQSFVAWLINTQRFRRDIVGLLSAQFAVDDRIRGEYRYATFHELHAYLGARMAEKIALEALEQAYKEWCEAYRWYFGGQVDPKKSKANVARPEENEDDKSGTRRN